MEQTLGEDSKIIPVHRLKRPDALFGGRAGSAGGVSTDGDTVGMEATASRIRLSGTAGSIASMHTVLSSPMNNTLSGQSTTILSRTHGGAGVGSAVVSQNIRDNCELLMANIRGGSSDLCPVRVIQFVCHNKEQFDEKEVEVQNGYKMWISKFAAIPSVAMPTLMETHFAQTHGELYLAAPRAPTIPLNVYYHSWVQSLAASRKGLQVPASAIRAEKEKVIGFLLREALKVLKSLHNRGLCHGSMKCSNIVCHQGLDYSSPAPLSLIDCGLYMLEGCTADSLAILASDYLPPPECREGTSGGSPSGSPLSGTQTSILSVGATSTTTAGASSASLASPHLYSTMAADVWGLGVAIVHLAEGAPPPFRRSSLSPMLKPSDWGPGLRVVVAKCLEQDPVKRATVDELLAHPFIAAAGNIACVNDAVLVHKPNTLQGGDSGTTGGGRTRGSLVVHGDPSKQDNENSKTAPAALPRPTCVTVSGSGNDYVHVVQALPKPETPSDPGPIEPTPDQKEKIEKMQRFAQRAEDLCSFVLFEALLDLLRDSDFSNSAQQTALNQLIATVRELEQISPSLANMWMVNLINALSDCSEQYFPHGYPGEDHDDQQQQRNHSVLLPSEEEMKDAAFGSICARGSTLSLEIGLPQLNLIRKQAQEETERHNAHSAGLFGQQQNTNSSSHGFGSHPNGGFTRNEMESYVYAKWGAVAADTLARSQQQSGTLL